MATTVPRWPIRPPEMGLIGADEPGPGRRAGRRTGPPNTHTIVRTSPGRPARGISRVVELDIPRPAGTANRSAYTCGGRPRGGYVAVEAADVPEAHRLARVRRDFVANVSMN